MTTIQHVSSVALLMVCAAQGPVRGQSASQEPRPGYTREAFVVETLRTVWRFEGDGTGDKDTAARVKIQSEAGVQAFGQLVFGYNAANERLEIGDVHVVKADGTRVFTSAKDVQDLTSAVERVAPVYTDAREKHVTVPSLRPGDVLEFSVRMTIETPLAPGQFWMEHNFAKSGIVLDEQLRVDVPADRSVTLKTRPGADPDVAERDGRRIYTWRTARLTNDRETEEKKTGRQVKPKAPEYAAVRLTTFPNWEAVGAWYAALERTSSRLIDAVGSTLELADASGALQTNYSFEPFGATAASGTSSTNVGLIRFRGHLWKGGYDVHTDGRDHKKEPAPPPAIRG